jgi:hypothetical protein
VQQVQDQSGAERRFDPYLQGAFSIGERQARLAALRIPALHLLGHLLDDCTLALEQTGPHALVFRTRGRQLVSRRRAVKTEEAFHNLFRGAHLRRAGEHSGHRGHSFAVGVLSLGELPGGDVVGLNAKMSLVCASRCSSRAFTRTYARLLRPKLAEIMPAGPPGNAALRAFDRLQAAIDSCCQEQKLVA